MAGVYRNILYRNLGNGKFEDVTEKAGIKSDKWPAAADWFDYLRAAGHVIARNAGIKAKSTAPWR